jgi:[ribosomal protein S5]-alanine N-acetyltransferase
MVPVPTIATKRLLLKPLSLADIPSYERHFVDYEVIRHLSAVVPWPYPKGGVGEYLQKVLPLQGISRWSWGLSLKENPTGIIGCVELWRPGTPENRGFWLGRKYWGRGLMGEAVLPILDFAFQDLVFQKLVFTNAVGNERSRRIKEKTGARLIEVRPAKFVDPTYTEHEIWELEKGEWSLRRGSS